MRISMVIDIDVPEDPTAEAVSYFVHQYGAAASDSDHSPEEWVERVVLDVLENELGYDGQPFERWTVVGSMVRAL